MKLTEALLPSCLEHHWCFGQADIVKQIWKELPKHMDTPVAPLDEEMLVDLAKEPAVIEGHWPLLINLEGKLAWESLKNHLDHFVF